MNNGTPTPRLRVLLLGPYPPPHGGVEMNLVAIRDFLLRRQIRCEVINLTRHRREEASGVYYPRNAIGVLRLLLNLKADIIHLHIGGEVSWRLLVLGFVCSLFPGRKAVLTLHSGGYPSFPAGRAARPMSLRGFCFRRYDALIGVNQEIVRMFQRFGVPARKARLILPFALPSEVPDIALSPNLQRFFQAHCPVLLTVSGLEPEYDVPLQIETLGTFREIHPKAGLVIIGTGSREEEIRKVIGAKPYGDHILLAGDIPHDAVVRAMSEADVFLRTTLYDGDSIAVREALHLGLPVIATDNGMRPSGVHLIRPGDQTALVEALASYANESSHPDLGPTPQEVDERNLVAVLRLYEELSGAGSSNSSGSTEGPAASDPREVKSPASNQ